MAKKGRKKKKSKRRRPYYKKRTGKRHVKGITGRIGAFILGVVPTLLAAFQAISLTNAARKTYKLDIFSTVQVGLMQWMDEMANGFLGATPFKKAVVTNTDGRRVEIGMEAKLQKGSLWYVAGTGLLMMAYDWVAGKLTSGKGTKIPFTNYYATGTG